MISYSETQKIIQELIEAANLYSNHEESFLTDEEFDAKQLVLFEIQEQYPELFAQGTDGYKLLDNDVQLGAIMDIDAGDEIVHTSQMLSLAKAKKPEQLESFVKKTLEQGAIGFNLQAKLDGCAISIKYVNGVMQYIATRGTGGNVGQNVTYLATEKNLYIKGFTQNLTTDIETVELRGEMYFTDAQFYEANINRKKYSGEEFENPRNALAGIIKRAKKGMPYKAEATFTMYSAISEDSEIKIDKIVKDNPELITIQQVSNEQCKNSLNIENIKTFDEVLHAVDTFGVLRESFIIPTDGVVIKPVNEYEMNQKMGYTSHHPSSQIAWKYKAEQTDTYIKNISFTVKKTGRITPVAQFEPVVKLDKSKIEFASLHNFHHMHTKNIKINSHVIVEKSNDIIPQVVTVLSNDKSVDCAIPTHCPICHTILQKADDNVPPKTLFCPNEDCDSRLVNTLIYNVSNKALDIDGLSEATVTTLFEQGKIKYIEDFYNLSIEDLRQATLQDSTDEKNVGKKALALYESIDKAKNLPLSRVITALGIKNIGTRLGKLLAKNFTTLDDLLQATPQDFVVLDGIAEKTAHAIYDGLLKNTVHLRALEKLGVIEIIEDKETIAPLLHGLSFSISGTVPSAFTNRDDWVNFVESHGGTYNSSPNKDTSYMIGDPSDSSAKIKKAVKLNIAFMSPEEFVEKFVVGS